MSETVIKRENQKAFILDMVLIEGYGEKKIMEIDLSKDICYEVKAFTHFMKKDGLISNDVSCIYEDKIGDLWFGSRGGLLFRYDGKSFTNFSKKVH